MLHPGQWASDKSCLPDRNASQGRLYVGPKRGQRKQFGVGMVQDAGEILPKLFIDPGRVSTRRRYPGVGSDRANNNRPLFFLIDYLEQLIQCFTKSLWLKRKVLNYYYFGFYPKITLNKQFAPHASNFSHRIAGVDRHRDPVRSQIPANGGQLHEINTRRGRVTFNRCSAREHRHMGNRT